jgi:4'-phosphopantetheinyl transferase EntD
MRTGWHTLRQHARTAENIREDVNPAQVLNGDICRQQTQGRATRRQKLLAAKFAGRNRIVGEATAAMVVYTARKREPAWPNGTSLD